MKYKGKKFTFRTKSLPLPNGQKKFLEYIEHPGAALIVPFLSKTQVVMIRQYRPAIGRYIYEFPAGTVDPGETPLQCAKRELTEEVFYAAGRLKRIGKIYPVPGYSDEVIHLYKAEDLIPKKGKRDEGEVIRVKVLTQREVVRLLRTGKITDAKTIAALARLGWV